MALNPRIDYKLNYIINFFSDMCDAPLSIYVKTLYPALLEAFLTYYEVDLMQVFTSYVRPTGPLKPTRGGPHGTTRPYPGDPDGPTRPKKGTKRTWLKYLGRITSFDPWDELGKGLQIFGDPSPRAVTPGVRLLWNIFDKIQTVQYTIMLYEIVEQFFYKWAQGVNTSEYCAAQFRPWCLCTYSLDGNIGLLSKTPSVIEEIAKARHTLYSAGNEINVKGAGSNCVFSAKQLTRGGHPPGEPGQRLRIEHVSGLVVESADFMQVGDTVVVSGGVTASGGWKFYSVGPGNYLLGKGEMSVIGMTNIKAG